MDKNKIETEIKEVESILNGALGTITASEAGDARKSLKALIIRKKTDLYNLAKAKKILEDSS